MRASLRFAFVFFWLALLLLAAGLMEPALAQTPTETPAAAASGAGAPADPGFAAWAEEKKAPIESINTLLLEAVKFVVLVGGLFVAVWAVICLIWRRPHELVLASMANATGDEETNAVADSLSVLMRIELVTQLERLHEHMRRYSQRADPRALPLPRLPLPAETPNERVKTLIDAVAEAAPDEGQQQGEQQPTPQVGADVGDLRREAADEHIDDRDRDQPPDHQRSARDQPAQADEPASPHDRRVRKHADGDQRPDG